MESNQNHSQALRLEYSSEIVDHAWDQFVCGLKDYHLEQTSAWGSLKNRQGWQTLKVKVFNNGSNEIIAGAQILEKKIAGHLNVGYLCRGPLYKDESDPIQEMLVRKIREIGKTRKYGVLIAALPCSKAHFAEVFEKNGFATHPSSLPPRSTMFSTLILDLADDADILMSKMRTTTRKHVRQGERRGITVREGGREDIGIFIAQYQELCSRRCVRPNVPAASVNNLFSHLARITEVKLFVAELNSEPIASMMVVANGEWARAWRIGWNGSNPDCRPNESLYWAVIKWAKSRGYRWFDFGGFDNEDAKGLANGMPPELIQCTISNFKYGFGGTPMLHPSQYSYVYNPLIRNFMKIAGDKLVQSEFARRFIRKYIESDL